MFGAALEVLFAEECSIGCGEQSRQEQGVVMHGCGFGKACFDGMVERSRLSTQYAYNLSLDDIRGAWKMASEIIVPREVNLDGTVGPRVPNCTANGALMLSSTGLRCQVP